MATITREMTLESAEHWWALANYEEDRSTWDRHHLPSIAYARATLYRSVALAMFLEVEMGGRHCSLCFKPMAGHSSQSCMARR